MPPFEGSRNIHEDLSERAAEVANAQAAVSREMEAHADLSEKAWSVLEQFGKYTVGGAIETPWVYNPSLESEGGKKVAYQLRSENIQDETGHDTIGPIDVVVKVEAWNREKPHVPFQIEETAARLNADVVFFAGDAEFDTYVQRLGTGLEEARPNPAVVRTRFPVAFSNSLGDLFQDTKETIEYIKDTLETRA